VAKGKSRNRGEKRRAAAGTPGAKRAERSAFRWFEIRFLGCLLLFSILVTVTSIQNHLWPVEHGLATAAAWGAAAARVHVERTGNLLLVGGHQLEINHECTAFFVLLIYASFLLAYPATPWERVRGFARGAVILMLVNAVRLAGLAIVVAWRPALFAYFHEYFWQVLFLGLTTALAHRWLSTLSVDREILVIPR